MITTVKFLELFYEIMRKYPELEGEDIYIKLGERIEEWKNENRQ